MKKSYIVAIDYRATYKPMTTDYKVLEADNLLDAMSEAESYLDTEKVYLLIIMQADKAGHKVKGMPGIRENTYIEQITNRGNGWHRTDAAHSETAWTKARTPSTSTATKLLEAHLMMTLRQGSKPPGSQPGKVVGATHRKEIRYCVEVLHHQRNRQSAGRLLFAGLTASEAGSAGCLLSRREGQHEQVLLPR